MNVDLDKLMEGLNQAENLVDQVYHYAMESGNAELQSIMNSAGTGINDGRNILDDIKIKHEKKLSNNELLQKLQLAQQLLSDVYYDACESGNSEIESNMSVADSCINDAMGMLETK